jgi:hypothetical protein
MGFYIYLVNHNSKTYTVIAKGSFSRERRYFALPSGWSREDDMEIMTEYVFNEQLKNRSSYDEVDQFEEDHETDSDDSEESESGQRDYKKSKYTSDRKTVDRKSAVGKNSSKKRETRDRRDRHEKHEKHDRSHEDRRSRRENLRKKESRDPLLSMPAISRTSERVPPTDGPRESSSIPDAPEMSAGPDERDKRE